MAKVLASTVGLYDPDAGRVVALLKGTVLPDWAEGLVDESRLLDDRVLSVFERLRNVGASDDEVTALQAAYALLDDDEKGDAGDIDVSDEELREQLADLRVAAAERGVTIAEAMTVAAAERDAPPVEPVKPLDEWRKDELVAKIDELTAAGVQVDVAPPGNKPELIEALRPHLDG